LGIDEMPGTGQTATTVKQNGALKNCGERYCVKKGDKSELIREMNIRLNGFGGNVPTDEFTDLTEKMIKQFQKDYMKIAPTGKVCGNTLKAIDEFGLKFTVNFNQTKCPCGVCSGYGQGKFLEQYNDSGIKELVRKYEYPGIHRSLIWALKATMFYLTDQEKGLKLKVGKISSGYRCHENNKQKGRSSTNHMGKALDVQFYPETGKEDSTEANCDKVRDLMKKYFNAQDRWKVANRIAMEPSTRIRIGKEFIATTWVHYDVREFDLAYKENRYFVTSATAANGEPMVTMAIAANLVQMCNCTGTGNASTAQNTAQAASGRVSPKTLKISQKGIDFIKDWEKFEPNAYNDSKDFCTIGYGHLIARAKCETITLPDEFKKGITKERATELFNGRLADFENAVKRDITVDLFQYEYDALVSLLFNTGSNFLNVGGAKKGETQIKKKINNSEYADGADQMSDVTNGGDKGLVKRRKAEINMFKNNVYDSTH
jgi:GH24 family phage-related lysozyme (muramidase)